MNHYPASAPQQVSRQDVRWLRLRAQALHPRLPVAKLVDTVRALGGVNAQLEPAMALALRAHVQDLTLADIEACRVGERSLVRTWCMRGTMHLLAADDVEWLLSTIPPAVLRSGWRWLEKRGGLERRQAECVLDDAYEALKRHGPMTRSDLMAALAAQHGDGIGVAAAGIVWLNGMMGRLCFGPKQGSQRTYVALDDWLGRPVRLAPKPDYVQLARSYLRGYGPAAPQDMAAWWGGGLAEASAAWGKLVSELVNLEVDGKVLSLLAPNQPAMPATADPIVRLLPAFDQYLLGYRQRDIAVAPAHQSSVFHGGELVPVVLVDGLAVGIWRYQRSGRVIHITVTPFSRWADGVRGLIAEEAGDIGRFFNLKSDLTVSASQ